MRGISSPATSPPAGTPTRGGPRRLQEGALQRLEAAGLEARLPEPPRRMEQVEVQGLAQREALAVEPVARLQEGHVEERAVEGDDALQAGEVVGQPAQEGRLL